MICKYLLACPDESRFAIRRRAGASAPADESTRRLPLRRGCGETALYDETRIALSDALRRDWRRSNRRVECVSERDVAWIAGQSSPHPVSDIGIADCGFGIREPERAARARCSKRARA